METESLGDKNEVFTNLCKLRDAQIQYKSLSFADDHTNEDRELIRANVSEA